MVDCSGWFISRSGKGLSLGSCWKVRAADSARISHRITRPPFQQQFRSPATSALPSRGSPEFRSLQHPAWLNAAPGRTQWNTWSGRNPEMNCESLILRYQCVAPTRVVPNIFKPFKTNTWSHIEESLHIPSLSFPGPPRVSFLSDPSMPLVQASCQLGNT